MRLIGALAMLASLAVFGAAEAEPIDRLFSESQLARVEPGAPLTYRHLRRGFETGDDAVAREEAIRLERDPATGHVLVTVDAGSVPRRLAPFRGMTGNPVLMVFLESVVASVADATGGNPFYLRARIKDAMRDGMTERRVTVDHAGSEVEAWELVIRPFRDDPHLAELGEFAGLALSFVLSDAVPGSFLSLSARAGEDAAGFLEEVRLDDPS